MRKRNKKVGLIVGKFLPFHLGHAMQIAEIAKSCDLLFVVLADSDARSKILCKECGLEYISPKTRFNWLEEYFKTFPNIKVKFLRQGMLEAYPDSLGNWKKNLSKKLNHNYFTWYVDKNFLQVSKDTFPEFAFQGFARQNINISAKYIRTMLEHCQTLVPKYIYKKLKFYFKNVK